MLETKKIKQIVGRDLGHRVVSTFPQTLGRPSRSCRTNSAHACRTAGTPSGWKLHRPAVFSSRRDSAPQTVLQRTENPAKIFIYYMVTE